MEDITRHMYDFRSNDATMPLCHNLLTGGAVVRQIIANVNCPACLYLWSLKQEDSTKLDFFAQLDNVKYHVQEARHALLDEAEGAFRHNVNKALDYLYTLKRAVDDM